jgi:hypothetical protein
LNGHLNFHAVQVGIFLSTILAATVGSGRCRCRIGILAGQAAVRGGGREFTVRGAQPLLEAALSLGSYRSRRRLSRQLTVVFIYYDWNFIKFEFKILNQVFSVNLPSKLAVLIRALIMLRGT